MTGIWFLVIWAIIVFAAFFYIGLCCFLAYRWKPKPQPDKDSRWLLNNFFEESE